MKRRDFLKKAGVGRAAVAATAVNAPYVIAQKKTTNGQTFVQKLNSCYKLSKSELKSICRVSENTPQSRVFM